MNLTDFDREVIDEMCHKALAFARGGPVFRSIARDYKWALDTIKSLGDALQRAEGAA